MKRPFALTLRCARWLLLVAVSWSVIAQAALPDSVSRAADSLGLADNTISIWVAPAAGGQPILSFNSDVPRNPASTLKVVTTYAALQGLGPAYR